MDLFFIIQKIILNTLFELNYHRLTYNKMICFILQKKIITGLGLFFFSFGKHSKFEGKCYIALWVPF